MIACSILCCVLVGNSSVTRVYAYLKHFRQWVYVYSRHYRESVCVCVCVCVCVYVYSRPQCRRSIMSSLDHRFFSCNKPIFTFSESTASFVGARVVVAFWFYHSFSFGTD